jgi:hypothetical protein
VANGVSVDVTLQRIHLCLTNIEKHIESGNINLVKFPLDEAKGMIEKIIL